MHLKVKKGKNVSKGPTSTNSFNNVGSVLINIWIVQDRNVPKIFRGANLESIPNNLPDKSLQNQTTSKRLSLVRIIYVYAQASIRFKGGGETCRRLFLWFD